MNLHPVPLAARAALRGLPTQRLCHVLESSDPERVRAAAWTLTEQLVPLQLRVCRSRLSGRPVEDIEDAASFAAQRLYARLLSGRPVDSPQGLAATIANAACDDHYRTQYRRAPEQPLDDERLGRVAAAKDVEQQVQDRLQLEAVVAQMTPDQRDVAAGRALGLESRAIGNALGKSANAVDAHSHRIRRTYGQEFDP